MGGKPFLYISHKFNRTILYNSVCQSHWYITEEEIRFWVQKHTLLELLVSFTLFWTLLFCWSGFPPLTRPIHLIEKTHTGKNSCVQVFAFGLISQYKNDMKELIDNRPSEKVVILRKVWKLLDTESQKNPQKKNTGNHLFYNASIFFAWKTLKFLFGLMSPSSHTCPKLKS